MVSRGLRESNGRGRGRWSADTSGWSSKRYKATTARRKGLKELYALLYKHELDTDHRTHVYQNHFQDGDGAFQYLIATMRTPIDRLQLLRELGPIHRPFFSCKHEIQCKAISYGLVAIRRFSLCNFDIFLTSRVLLI